MMLKTQMFIHNLMTKVTHPFANEEGATAVEYGLMVALISVAIIVTVTAIGAQLNVLFGVVRDALLAA